MLRLFKYFKGAQLCLGWSFSTEKQLLDSQKYCDQTLRKHNWATHALGNYYPAKVRPSFYAINCFSNELTKISKNAREPSLAIGRLQFWRNTINKIYNNQDVGAEPISISLHNSIHNSPLTKGYFSKLIDLAAKEINTRSINTFNEMLFMAQAGQSTLLAMNLELLQMQIQNSSIREVVTLLGRAIGIVEYLKRVPFALRNNRFFLPEDILAQHNLHINKLWDRVHGKPYEQFYDVVLQLASYAKNFLQEAVQLYKQNPNHFPKHSHRAFLKAVETQLYLQKLEKCNFDIFTRTMNKGSPILLPIRLYMAVKKSSFSNK